MSWQQGVWGGVLFFRMTFYVLNDEMAETHNYRKNQFENIDKNLSNIK